MYQQLGSSFLIFSPFRTVNSKNPLLLFGTRVVEWSDTVEVPFSDTQSFFEFLSIVQLPIAFFGSQLVLLINYAISLLLQRQSVLYYM